VNGLLRARAIFFYRLGEMRDRSFESQAYRASGLNLLVAAADDFDLRMLPKPFGCPGGCAILQHVDDLAPLEVNDNSPVSATLSPAPIVDACHRYRRSRAETGDLPFQMLQNGVVADWHAETFHQPFSRPATSAVAER
jgi:hypothetical protein